MVGKAQVSEHMHGTWHKIENHINCYFLNLVNTLQRKTTWTGKCENGFAQGEGVISYKSKLGETYLRGNFIDGVMQGHGVLRTWMNRGGERRRLIYSGNFAEGAPEGLGIFSIHGFVVYSGYMKDMRPHGRGVMVMGNDLEMDPEIEETGDLQSIRGTKLLRREGTFVHGALEGPAKVSMPDGSTCTGTWKNDKLDGFGIGVREGVKTICLLDENDRLVFVVDE